MNDLYTVIMDFESGTYISQVRANNPEHALKVWVDKLDFEKMGLSHLSLQAKRNFFIEISNSMSDDDFYLSSLEGLKSVWCGSVYRIGESLALINIVLTKNH